MKTLYVVRHAKAISRERPVPDFERPLRQRGRNDAQKMAQYVASQGPAPDVILSSPAPRAIDTARLFAEAWHYPAETIITHQAIYDQAETAGEHALLHLIHALEASCQTAMIVGHDPMCSAFARVLDATFTEWLPTCGVVCFALQVNTWAEVAPGCGTVRFFHAPKRQAPWLPLSEDELAATLTEQLHQTIAAWHPEVAARMQKSLRKAATKVARQCVTTLHAVHTKASSGGNP